MTSLFGGVTVLPSNAAPVFQVQEFIPTAGQTVFTLTQFSYTLGGKTLWVLVNGQKQVYNVDYTETSANSFTMTSALGVTDLVEVITFTLSNVTASTDAAAASASAAAASAAAAAASYDSFDDRYLGVKTADPSVDNDGNALQIGALYFNSLSNTMRVYDATIAWANVGVATPITVNIERFSGTGVQTVFTLANAPAFQNACEILISGVGQTPGVDYTVTGVPLKTLTFTTAPPAGTLNITVRSLSAYAGGVPNDLSVSTSKLVDLAVTTAKMANAGYEFGMRNRIINGGMAVAQRGAVALVLGNDVYGGVDRTTAGIFNFTTASGLVTQSGLFGASWSSTGYLQAAQVTSTGTGVVRFTHKIEAQNTVDLNGKPITIQCVLLQQTGATLNATISVYKASAIDNWSSPVLLGTSGNFAVLGDNATKTAASYTLTLGASDATNGLMVIVQFPTVGAVTSKNFYIGDLQLEKGSTATPFEYRPYGTELALCQRYYYRQTAGSANNERLFPSGVIFNSTTAQGIITYPVPMRALPTSASVGNPTNLLVWTGTNYVVSGASADTIGLTNANFAFTCAAGATAGQACQITRNAASTPAPYFEVSAEL